DARYRFEFVDQDGIAKDAKANTLRSRFGVETGRFHGIGFGVDAEGVLTLGEPTYNSTTNGRTRYPVVADPEDLQLNQAFLVFDGTIPGTMAKLGRQRIVWDNARFIGNVGFRQNEQTFDAARAVLTAVPDTEFDYAYLAEVHRVFGNRSFAGTMGMSSHAIRAHYDGLGAVAVTPFALLLDYDRSDQAANSSATFGALADGRTALSEDWALLYEAGLAHQQDAYANPRDFGLWYYAVRPGLAWKDVSARLGYEVLQGNGRIGFRTPLATLHKFNGLTDKFLTTPAKGIQDINLALAAKLPPGGWLGGLSLVGAWHEFYGEDGGGHYGREWNIGAFRTLPTSLGSTPLGDVSLGIQFARYDADAFATDTSKLWLTLQFKLSPEPYRRAVRPRIE
ncbi:MAG: alginate export family protein, partial [Rhodospirillaceae bacterium]|nr:alginate export family protein [Rhodospirillaceae bacterium]